VLSEHPVNVVNANAPIAATRGNIFMLLKRRYSIGGFLFITYIELDRWRLQTTGCKHPRHRGQMNMSF